MFMTVTGFEVSFGFFAVIIFGIISLKLQIVDFSGFIAGLGIGWTIFVFGGWRWFILILTFHLVAGLSTKYKYKVKRMKGVAEEKGGSRAWPNVLANGSVAALLAMLNFFNLNEVAFAGYLGAISTAIADTLATEIGLLSPQEPRSIINFKKVPSGTSGGVSLLGELATIVSAALIGVIAYVTRVTDWSILRVILISTLSGFSGSTFDSIIGGTLQAQYRCIKCGKNTEKSRHCRKPSIQIRGCRWIDNNIVNLISISIGATVGVFLFHVM
jgi:uncharacterized protein (TIGR00297 family)